MKKALLFSISLAFTLFLALPTSVQAQCNSSGGNSLGAINPTAIPQTTGCVTGGDYFTFTGVPGQIYTFSFCNGGGTATFDTQITITDNSGTPVTGGYNDDNCGLQSEVSWVCSAAGTYRVYITNYNCVTGTTCGTLAFASASPPAGGYCTTAVPVPSLPFNLTGQTTCGKLDIFSSANTCGSVYMNGEDMVFEYTSAGSETIDIALTNTGTFVGVFVTLGCPDDASSVCIPPSGSTGACGSGGAASNTSSTGNPSATFTLGAAGTYYIIVSTFPAPQCTPFDISITSSSATGTLPGLGCYTTSSITYSPDPYNSGTILAFPDDEFSNIVPIGFNFCFMGNEYSNMVVSSNGYVTFETVCAGEYSTYVTEAIPTTNDDVLNSILGFWQDIDPNVGGTIRLATLGTAPNRRAVVNYESIPLFSAACNSMLFTGQIVMYETTNIIEVNIQNKPICTSWENGEAVQGLNDATGTVAVVFPGRNDTQWIVNNDAVRFTPTCDVCNTILPVSYLTFSGQATEQGNLIQWDTHIENGVQEFVLEQSADGQTFRTIDSRSAVGSATEGANYEVLDRNPLRPITYYRLREINSDGAVSYSEVISVQPDAALDPVRNIYVDNVYGQLVVDLDMVKAGEIQFDIMDGMGKVVFRADQYAVAGAQTLRFDVSQLANGYYILRTSDATRMLDARKFVIAK